MSPATKLFSALALNVLIAGVPSAANAADMEKPEANVLSEKLAGDKAGYAYITGKLASIYMVGSEVMLVFRNGIDAPECTSASVPEIYYATPDQAGLTQLGLENVREAALSAGENGLAVTIAFDPATPKCQVHRLQVRY